MLQIVKRANTNTGEVYYDKKTFIEDTLNEDGYRVPSHKKKAAMFSDVPFPEQMTDAEIGKMARLAKLMIPTSNMLGYRKHSGILPYTEAHLIEILSLSKKRGKEFINKMISLGMMQKNIRIVGDIESEEYYINPAYFFAGKRIGLNLYLLFRENLDPILPPWVKSEFLSLVNEQVKR